MAKAQSKQENFQVPLGKQMTGAFVAATPGLQKALSVVESWALRDEIDAMTIEKPVYVCSVARSGTTITLEQLSKHVDITSHRYNDFPWIYTPYWSNWLRARLPGPEHQLIERAHRDTLLITPDSPDAMEEGLWMAFFDHLHDPSVSNILDASTENPEFEKFYTEHIKKLLLVRGRGRYLAKGNYNVTRMLYLQKLFPDARFVIPVRHPVWHVASSIKTHKVFLQRHEDNPETLKYMQREGHFEFGLDRRPINTGNAHEIAEIQALWDEGRDICGWARYWAAMYRYIYQVTQNNPAMLCVQYQDLCQEPKATLQKIYAHIDLPIAAEDLEKQAKKIKAPGYYKPKFSDVEMEILAEETGEVAALYGYNESWYHPESFDQEAS